jgi:hypothetical protein
MLDWNNIKKYIESKSSGSPMTKTVLNYLIFVFISFMFWAFLSLNNNIQHEIEIPIKINEIPDSSTIITSMPTHLSVNVKDKGISLLKFLVGKTPVLNLKFKDYALQEGVFFISNTELRRKIRGLFDNSTTIQGISIENINIKYTNLPGKKVPIRLDLDIKPNIQYVIYGSVEQDVDSAIVFADRNALAEIDEVYTYRVVEQNLKDTLLRTVAIAPIQNVKIEPERIQLTIPVEPLISKKLNIPVQVKNMPKEMNVITFPSVVEVSFLVPFSMYRKNIPMAAVVDFNDIKRTKGNKVNVKIEESPALYNNISLGQDSVEFIIEKH